uniref:RIIa domain-containing protein n=1 Tax=Cyclopterus lumpus TaxID=8103 RepID=A0A8C2WBD4_CYCLU
MTFPYGLKSLVESISRAVLLAEPANIPDFLNNYMTELISFRSCHAGTYPKLVSFDFEEFWGKLFSFNVYNMIIYVTITAVNVVLNPLY